MRGRGPVRIGPHEQHLHVVVRQQPLHLPEHGGPPEAQHLLGLVLGDELLHAEQPRAPGERGRAAEPEPARLRDHRPVVFLGPFARGAHPGIAGDHQTLPRRGHHEGRQRAEVGQLGPPVAPGPAVQRLVPVGAVPVGSVVGVDAVDAAHVGAAPVGDVRHQGFPERDVEVDGAAPPLPVGGVPRPADLAAPVGVLAGPVFGHGEFVEVPHRAAVEGVLVDHLVRPGRAQLGRPVGGEHDQRHPGPVGLQHRRVQIRRGGARRAHHGHRTAGAGGDPEGEEGSPAFVDAHVQPHPARRGGVVQRERQRGVA